QVDFALNRNLRNEKFPFSKLKNKKVNTLIYPDIDAANGTYKLIKELNDTDSIGPILIGLSKPAHIFQLGASVDEMVNMSAVGVVDAQRKEKKKANE
ncbi:MAG: phosphate acyltransferase, partial [Flavobacteriaceae bacterium]